MFISGVWILLSLTVNISKQECSLLKSEATSYDEGFYEHDFFCEKTNPQHFLYDFLHISSDVINSSKFYNLTISNSEFVHIHAFLPPLASTSIMKKFALINSSVEHIENWAFEKFTQISDLVLSNNKLNNMLFVSTLPASLISLHLDGNDFEVVTNVFNHLNSLRYLDLSNCKISMIEPKSFSRFYPEICLSLKNNRLTSFDLIFEDSLELEIDLSLNNIKNIDYGERRIYFRGLNASHNKIQNISDISCQDCGYGYYRRAINFIDLSSNDLHNVTYLNFFSGIKVENLNLSNSNIDANFNFEVLKSVKNTVDLSNNNLRIIKSNMFGYDVDFYNLLLVNSSINYIYEKAFGNYRLGVLNISFNGITKLANYTFGGSSINILDISNCLIRKIESNAFYGVLLADTLNLSHNHITHLNKNIFENLSHVIKLDLSFNLLRRLDNNLFFNCANLRTLNLANSGVEIVGGNTLTGTSLSELHLQNNLLNEIDFQISNPPNLINLNNNTISNLSFSFLRNASATVLLLTRNNLGKLLNNSDLQFASVKEIYLSESNVHSIEAGAFRGLIKLESLNLSCNKIEKILPKTFLPLRDLIRLDLSGNKIFFFSPEAFSFGNQLREFSVTFFNTHLTSDTFIFLNYLKNLTISDSHLIAMEDGCFRGLIYLENLNLFNVEIMNLAPGMFKGLNNLQGIDFQILFKNLNVLSTGTFESLPKLIYLDLSNLEISSIQAEAFRGIFNVDELLLTKNKLKKIVNNTFLGLNSLERLDLSGNQISVLETKSFFGLNNLKELFLNDNNITKLVLGTFQEFPLLKVLNLHKNNISKLLTGTFSNLNFLNELDLSNNNITKLKMQSFVSLSNLTRLDLTDNNLIQMTHLDLVKSLRRLKFLGLNGNKWKCDNLSSMLITFRNFSINWVSDKSMTFTQENIDGIKCYDICKFFYCVDEEEILWGAK